MSARTREEMQQLNIELQGAKSKAEKKPAPKSRRRKRLNEVSEKKGLTDLVHEAYRDAFIFLARRYDDMKCWVCGIECKPSQLDLHHDTRRGQGGKHAARNYLLVCNRKSQNGANNCHDRLDGNDVRWTGRTA